MCHRGERVNRKTDEPSSDFSHQRRDVCLKEDEWREMHDFLAGTKEYRKALNDQLLTIQKSIGGFWQSFWALLLVVVIPFVCGFVWIGQIDNQVKVNTQRWERLMTNHSEVK